MIDAPGGSSTAAMAPSELTSDPSVRRVVVELIDLAMTGRLFVEKHRVAAREAADDVTPGLPPPVARVAGV